MVILQDVQCAFSTASLPCSSLGVAADMLDLVVCELGYSPNSAEGAEMRGVALELGGMET